jgi:copper transport protein
MTHDRSASVIRSGPRFFGLVLCAVAAVIGFTQSPAAAHNSLVESNPKSGAVLASAPLEWTLTFANYVPLSSASAEVIDSSGVRITLLAPRHGVNQKQIVFSLPQNLTGAVTARWKLVNNDGHVVTERVTFTVGTGSTSAPVAGATVTTVMTPSAGVNRNLSEATTPEVVRYALRLLGYLAILAYGGLVVNMMLVGPSLQSVGHVQTIAIASSAALVLAPLAQLLVFLDDTDDTGVIGSVPRILGAFDTTAGSMLFVRAVIGWRSASPS